MKTLVVYYSKTGNTAKAAKAIANAAQTDCDEIQYDEKSKTIRTVRDPAVYDRVILLSPVWAFALAEPVKLYLARHKAGIKRYALVVTCASAGLRGCVRNCVSALGAPPEKALKIKAKLIKTGQFDISAVLGG